MHAFVADITSDDLKADVPVGSVDICTMVFVLSAITPAKMPLVWPNSLLHPLPLSAHCSPCRLAFVVVYDTMHWMHMLHLRYCLYRKQQLYEFTDFSQRFGLTQHQA